MVDHKALRLPDEAAGPNELRQDRAGGRLFGRRVRLLSFTFDFVGVRLGNGDVTHPVAPSRLTITADLRFRHHCLESGACHHTPSVHAEPKSDGACDCLNGPPIFTPGYPNARRTHRTSLLRSFPLFNIDA